MKTLWTEAEILELKVLLKKKTYKEIAAHFGISIDALRHQLRKNNLTNVKRRIPPHARSIEELTQIFKWSEKKGCKAAAEKYGLTVEIVKNIRQRYKKHKDRIVQQVSPEEALKKRKQALSFAYKKGIYQEHAEDFASYAILSVLERGYWNLEHLLVDYKRETFGNFRTEKGKSKVFAENFAHNIDKIEVEDVEGIDWSQLAGFPKKRVFRVCFLLVYQWGFQQREVAELFGVDETQIVHIMKEVHKTLKNKKEILETLQQKDPVIRFIPEEN